MNTPTQSITEQQAAMVEDMMEMYLDGKPTGILIQNRIDINHFDDDLTDWTKPDAGVIHVPDHFDKLFNSFGMQMRFVTISGKNEVQAIAHMVHNAHKFFHNYYRNKYMGTHETPINSTNGDGG